jgi:hypothetical protein
VELTTDPAFDIIALTTRSGGHERSEERFGVGFERGGGILAELAGGSSALACYPPTNPVHQHTARAGCFAEDFAFDNVIGHDV